MRPAFLFEACRVRQLDDGALLADPALAALDPDLDSVLNLNEPSDYEAARARPGPAVTVRRFGALTDRARGADPPSCRPAPRRAAASAGSPSTHFGRGAERLPDHARPLMCRCRGHSSPFWAATRRLASRSYAWGMQSPPSGLFRRALVIELADATPRCLPLDDTSCALHRGAGCPVLMHRLAPPGVDPLAPRRSRVRSLDAGRDPSPTSRSSRRGESRHRAAERPLASQHFAIAASDRPDATSCSGVPEPSLLPVYVDGPRLEPAFYLWGCRPAGPRSASSGWSMPGASPRSPGAASREDRRFG